VGLEELAELVKGQLAIAEYTQQEPGADYFGCMDRYDRSAAIGVTEGVVTAANADDLKATIRQCRY